MRHDVRAWTHKTFDGSRRGRPPAGKGAWPPQHPPPGCPWTRFFGPLQLKRRPCVFALSPFSSLALRWSLPNNRRHGSDGPRPRQIRPLQNRLHRRQHPVPIQEFFTGRSIHGNVVRMVRSPADRPPHNVRLQRIHIRRLQIQTELRLLTKLRQERLEGLGRPDRGPRPLGRGRPERASWYFTWASVA